MSLNASIEKRLELIEQSEQEYKTHKEMLTDALANDGELVDLEEKAKDAKRRATAQKEALMGEPENAKIQEQMKELAQEIKDAKKLLGDELLTYFMQNNSLEYIDGKGKKRQINVSAKFGKGKEDE